MVNLINFFLNFKNNIKKYWKWIVGIYIVLTTVLLLIFMNSYKRAKIENGMLTNNQTALMTDIEYYKTESGRNASKIMTTTSCSELDTISLKYEKNADKTREIIVAFIHQRLRFFFDVFFFLSSFAASFLSALSPCLLLVKSCF